MTLNMNNLYIKLVNLKANIRFPQLLQYYFHQIMDKIILRLSILRLCII
jgi:hypothetical protein